MQRWRMARAMAVWCMVYAGMAAAAGQQLDNAAILRGIDASVKARLDGIAGYTDIEHYKVFRNNDETHPAAEMVVKTTYEPKTGKNYTILSQSGSAIILKYGLKPLLDNEKAINEPGKIEASWFVSTNYEMNVKPGGPVEKDGRACWAVSIRPNQKAPNLIEGTLWVDAHDFSIVRVEGISSKSPSIWSGAAHVMRKYEKIGGFAEATHARAESDSFLLGRTVVTIDYEGYQIQSRLGR
jgi:hypothetical protein